MNEKLLSFFSQMKIKSLRLSLEKKKGRKLRYRNSNYTSTSNPAKKREQRDLRECSLTTGISQVRSGLKITYPKDRGRREVNSEQIQQGWSELIQTKYKDMLGENATGRK